MTTEIYVNDVGDQRATLCKRSSASHLLEPRDVEDAAELRDPARLGERIWVRGRTQRNPWIIYPQAKR